MDSESLKQLAPYITLVAGIIVAYLTFRNQLRLKSFELLLKRREEVLNDIEKEIETLQLARRELDQKEIKQTPHLDNFRENSFHNGLILHHKIKGANFGGVAQTFVESYWHLQGELIFKKNKMTNSELKDYIQRVLNILSVLYGFAHSRVNTEIEIITLPWYLRIFRKIKDIYIQIKHWYERKKHSK